MIILIIPQHVKALYNLIKFTLPFNLKSVIPSDDLDKINLVIKSSSKLQAYERLNSIFQNHELNCLLSNKIKLMIFLIILNQKLNLQKKFSIMILSIIYLMIYYAN